MKASKTRRKLLNELRHAGGVPMPPRQWRVVPTFGNVDRLPVGRCTKIVSETKVRKRRLSRAKTVPVVCGGRVVATRGRHRRRVFCESCANRRSQARLLAKLSEMRRVPLHQQQREQTRTARLLARFHRRSA